MHPQSRGELKEGGVKRLGGGVIWRIVFKDWQCSMRCCIHFLARLQLLSKASITRACYSVHPRESVLTCMGMYRCSVQVVLFVSVGAQQLYGHSHCSVWHPCGCMALNAGRLYSGSYTCIDVRCTPLWAWHYIKIYLVTVYKAVIWFFYFLTFSIINSCCIGHILYFL